MATVNKTKAKEFKDEYVRLMSEYYDAMVEYDIIRAEEIVKELYDIYPFKNLLFEFTIDVETRLKTDRNFVKKINEEIDKEELSFKEIVNLMNNEGV